MYTSSLNDQVLTVLFVYTVLSYFRAERSKILFFTFIMEFKYIRFVRYIRFEVFFVYLGTFIRYDVVDYYTAVRRCRLSLGGGGTFGKTFWSIRRNIPGIELVLAYAPVLGISCARTHPHGVIILLSRRLETFQIRSALTRPVIIILVGCRWRAGVTNDEILLWLLWLWLLLRRII